MMNPHGATPTLDRRYSHCCGQCSCLGQGRRFCYPFSSARLSLGIILKNRHFGSNFVVHFPILAEESSAHDVSLNSALKSMTSNFRLTSPVMSSTPFHQTPIRLPARRSTASNSRVNPIPANISS